MIASVQQQGGGRTTSVQQQGVQPLTQRDCKTCCRTLAVTPPDAGSPSCCRTLAVTPPDADSPSCCSTLAVTPMHHKGLLGWRYNSRCNYMITLVTEPRTSVFGELREWGVERTDEGRVVYDVWQMIEKRFPMVRATYNAIMPDHFHGIIFITTDGEVGLDDVVAFFAAEVERRIGRRVWCNLWRDSICLAKGQLHRQINYVLSNAKRRWIKENNPELFRKVMGFRHWRLDLANETLAGVPEFDERYFRGDSFGREDREFWDLETGEEIVKPRKANRVQRAFDGGRQQAYNSKVGGRQQAYNSKVGGRQQAYDNNESFSSTLAVTSPDGNPSCCSTLAVTPPHIEWTALGNPFLLDAPLLIALQIPAEASSDFIDDLAAKIVTKTERGAVVVGTWMSPGEQTVKKRVLECGGSLVQLLPEGMGRYYKPSGRDFDRCAEGRMLVLSPFAPREAGRTLEKCDKLRFEWLNFVVRAMGDLTIGGARVQPTGHGETTSVQQQGGGETTSVQQQGGGETTSVQQQGWGETTSVRQQGGGETTSVQQQGGGPLMQRDCKTCCSTLVVSFPDEKGNERNANESNK